MVIAFAVCSAPWIYRNTTVFGVPTLFDTKAGIQLYLFRDEGPSGVKRAFSIPPDLTGENEGKKNAVYRTRFPGHERRMSEYGSRHDRRSWRHWAIAFQG
jgi:hypothetical protein